MEHTANLQLLMIGGMVVFGMLMVKLVRYIKTRRINTELWCTVFEGLTQGAIRLDDLKAPESVIEKRVRRDGRGKESFEGDATDALATAPEASEQSASPQNKSGP